MQQYLKDLQFVQDNGSSRLDRTGVGTYSVFGMQSRYDLSKGFPAVTTKQLAWKSVVSELLWFIEGSSDERRLCEILHGTRDTGKKTIWTDNANSDYWTPSAKFKGDCGKIYGYQWRHWATPKLKWLSSSESEQIEIDQLADLIKGIKNNPFGRRHILTAWNVADLNDMALPPCHCFSQFYVTTDGKLSCQLYQRSADMPLGVPFNIASYALLTHMIAQVCKLKVGEFIHTLGDAHIYTNQINGVDEQLKREPLPLPTIQLNPNIKNIDDFSMNDIELLDYNSLPPIKFPFAV